VRGLTAAGAMPEPSAGSLGDNLIEIEAGAHVVAATFLSGRTAFALADGTLVLHEDEQVRRLTLHKDATLLVASHTPLRLASGGDDGRVVVTDGHDIQEIAEHRGQWIDAIALRADGAIAWSCGKQLTCRDAEGQNKSLTLAASVRGIAFLPKGYRLAASHYNGVSLWFPNTQAEPELLAWKGSHIDVTASPDGRFVVSSMQENCLHGWKLADKQNMRMSGYPAKTRSLSWSADGHWLATSGADACILWPFQAKNGPMGQAPRECGGRPARVTQVAFHPTALIAAIGYEDGWLMLCRMTDGAELPVRAPTEPCGAISAIGWDPKGLRLAFGSRTGEAFLLTLPS
jgi:WD40 repeat protein